MLSVGQACVFYGAAEFSRDLDLLILADPANLALLRAALDDLQAEVIAVPSFDPSLLARGHAVHFRCRRPDVAGLRIDLMAALRGVAGFEELWQRRTTMQGEDGIVNLLSVEDLVSAKKTQRDKDWPMIRRLVEQSYFASAGRETPELVGFWLRELRTPELLLRVASANSEAANRSQRPAVAAALSGSADEVEAALITEEQDERRRDRAYWAPLKRELEALRLGRKPAG